ncbi:hypothetical protein Syn7502_01399 [Synechococcus sp. PCC 7502]|uniref:hypothetical protein n=1 Tax=Synechococcus sp. PCC 7502 TaxID=1173263 RepID=UPI00029F8472|nr:hypothetical protein [Synechococcus sp. PCC 7502]AFY73480.1 hypothetical protein Syn7502_01399 [Synechococcus sp. PCC 7502]
MLKTRGHEATLKKFLPVWKHGKTKTIRVPIVLAGQILEYARSLDADEAILSEHQSQGNVLLTVVEMLESVATAKFNNFTTEHELKLSKAIEMLKYMKTK